jgi:SP family myo-inositol transporter-like MFS transporter 13
MADAADQPLMGQQSGDDARSSEEADLPNVSLLPEKDLGQPGIYVWLLTFSAGISGLLFGCRCSEIVEMKIS